MEAWRSVTVYSQNKAYCSATSNDDGGGLQNDPKLRLDSSDWNIIR